MPQSLSAAQRQAWNLATTLMVCVLLFEGDDGQYGVMPTSEFDGEPDTVIHEFDPFQV